MRLAGGIYPDITSVGGLGSVSVGLGSVSGVRASSSSQSCEATELLRDKSTDDGVSRLAGADWGRVERTSHCSITVLARLRNSSTLPARTARRLGRGMPGLTSPSSGDVAGMGRCEGCLVEQRGEFHTHSPRPLCGAAAAKTSAVC